MVLFDRPVTPLRSGRFNECPGSAWCRERCAGAARLFPRRGFAACRGGILRTARRSPVQTKVLHGSATTTETESVGQSKLVKRVREGGSRQALRASAPRPCRSGAHARPSTDARMGPKEPTLQRAEPWKTRRSSLPSSEHTLLPLDDCLYALQPTLPHLTRSSLHRCLQRHGMLPCRMWTATSPSGRASRPTRSATSISTSQQVSTEQGKLHLFVAIDRTSKFAFVQTAREGALNGSRQSLSARSRRQAVP